MCHATFCAFCGIELKCSTYNIGFGRDMKSTIKSENLNHAFSNWDTDSQADTLIRIMFTIVYDHSKNHKMEQLHRDEFKIYFSENSYFVKCHSFLDALLNEITWTDIFRRENNVFMIILGMLRFHYDNEYDNDN